MRFTNASQSTQSSSSEVCARGRSTPGDTASLSSSHSQSSEPRFRLASAGREDYLPELLSQKLQEHCRASLAPGTREARPFPVCHSEAST